MKVLKKKESTYCGLIQEQGVENIYLNVICLHSFLKFEQLNCD